MEIRLSTPLPQVGTASSSFLSPPRSLPCTLSFTAPEGHLSPRSPPAALLLQPLSNSSQRVSPTRRCSPTSLRFRSLLPLRHRSPSQLLSDDLPSFALPSSPAARDPFRCRRSRRRTSRGRSRSREGSTHSQDTGCWIYSREASSPSSEGLRRRLPLRLSFLRSTPPRPTGKIHHLLHPGSKVPSHFTRLLLARLVTQLGASLFPPSLPSSTPPTLSTRHTSPARSSLTAPASLLLLPVPLRPPPSASLTTIPSPPSPSLRTAPLLSLLHVAYSYPTRRSNDCSPPLHWEPR